MNEPGFLDPERRKGAKIIRYQQANISVFEEGAGKVCHPLGWLWDRRRLQALPLATPTRRARCRSGVTFIPHRAGMCNFGHARCDQEAHKEGL